MSQEMKRWRETNRRYSHSHSSAEVNGCCAMQIAKERDANSYFRYPPACNISRMTTTTASRLFASRRRSRDTYIRRFTLVLLPSVLGILRFTVVALGFSPCDGISLFPPWGRKPRTSYTSLSSKQRGTRVPLYERTSICSEVCKLFVYGLQAEKFSPTVSWLSA